MLKHILVPVLLFFNFNQIKAQVDENNLDIDSVYFASAMASVDYLKVAYNSLDNYFIKLKKPILTKLSREDAASIKKLNEAYQNNILLLEKQVIYSYLNNDISSKGAVLDSQILLDIKTFYPDSYAFLFNDTNPVYKPLKDHLKLRDYLFEKYSQAMDPQFSKWQDLKSSLKKSFIETRGTDILQNYGNKTEIENQKSDFIDLLLWVVNYSERPTPKKD